MATAIEDVRRTTIPGPPRRVVARDGWLRLLVGWHALLGTAALVAVAVLLASGSLPSGLAGVGVLVVLVALAAANVVAAPLLARRDGRGRGIALTVNYLGFLACALALLQATRVFVGLDALGGTFVRGVPFLAIALVGYLMTGFRDMPERPGPLRRAGRIVMLVGLAATLFAVGLIPGLVTFATRLASPVPFALLLGAVAFGLLSRLVWRADVARAFSATSRQTEALTGFLFVSPNLLPFAVFFAGPLVFSLYVSLNDWGIAQEAFVGIDNYVEILSLDLAPGGAALQTGYAELLRIGDLVVGARDVLFWRSLRNIALFSFMAVPLAVVPALLLATLLNSKAPGIRIFRALYFVPTVAGVVGVTLIWKQLFNSTVGFVNYLILRAAELLNALPGVDVAAPQPQWLSDADIAIFSLVIVFAWQYLGYNTILFMAGLQAVPADLYEAAHLDGANRWQRFRNITLPVLAPTTFFVVAVTSILALQLFTESVVLFSNFTPPGSGPNNAALTPVAYLYQEGFQRFSQGYASAVAWVLFVLIFSFTFVQFRRQRAQAEGI